MWKGKCRMFWNQFFLIHRHASTDERSTLFDQLLPNRLLSHKHELFVYFERTHSNNQNYLRHKIRQYGEHFLNETAAGKAWRSQLKSLGAGSVFVDTPTAPTDLMLWQGLQGIEFTRFHCIDFWKKFLVTCDTEEADEGYIGWLAGDNDGFWLDNLTNVALKLILLYVQIEGPMPDSVKATTITRALSNVGFEVPEIKEWPEFDPSIVDPMVLVNDTRHLPAPAGSGNLGNSVHFYTDDALSQKPTVGGRGLGTSDSPLTAVAPEPPAAPPTPEDLENIPPSFEDDEAVIRNNPGLTKAIKAAVSKQEQDFCDASIALLNNAGIPHERQKITISDKPIRTPSYANSLSETYGALNIWGQIRLMKMNIMHKMKELDAEAWEISCKKSALTKENEELDKQLAALRTKLQWRQEHMKELNMLSKLASDKKQEVQDSEAELSKPDSLLMDIMEPSSGAAGGGLVPSPFTAPVGPRGLGSFASSGVLGGASP